MTPEEFYCDKHLGPNLEPTFVINAYWGYIYAVDILKERFILGEKEIFKEYKDEYIKEFSKPNQLFVYEWEKFIKK